MSNYKLSLLIATAMTGTMAGAANAQVVLPAAELRGTGATTVGVITQRWLDCVGGTKNPLGINDGTTEAITAGVYSPTLPGLTNPPLDCATQQVQPNIDGKYVNTGSGQGRTAWSTFTNIFTGAAGAINPFDTIPGPGGEWNNVQFGLSESPVSGTNVTAYNANAAPKAGYGITVPLFVVPISLAYNPTYGYKDKGLISEKVFTFNNLNPGFINGQPSGGIRMSKQLYCRIFNGQVTNWNDALFTPLNKNRTLMDGDDVTARWTTEGVPIRLAGRMDSSGGTDVFVRHLALACPGLVTTNKFVIGGGRQLPYSGTGGPDFRSFVASSPYFPTAATTGFSSTIQSVSGAVYERSTGNINSTLGVETPGLFLLADGSVALAEAIFTEGGNNLLPSTAPGTLGAGVVLNGKFGYIGADYVTPSAGQPLFSAALQQGTTTAYVTSTAANATKAMGTILPPQTLASSGAFNATDNRNSNVNTGKKVSRAFFRDWYEILYSRADQSGGNTGPTLGNPTLGYPITAVAQLMTYTCFSTQGKQLGMANAIAAYTAKITKKSDNSVLSANTFKGGSAANLGIATKSNIGALPGAWANAIFETFLKKSTQASGGAVLGTLNSNPDLLTTAGTGLWIQDYFPTKTTDFDGTAIGANKEVKRNPDCVTFTRVGA